MSDIRALVRQHWFGYMLLLPSLLMIAVIAFYPALNTMWASLHRESLIIPGTTFVGLRNFEHLLADAKFWNAWRNTIYFTVLTVELEMLLGLGIALVMHEQVPGRAIVRVVVLVPWVIPTAVSSRLWGLIFSTDSGLANYLLMQAHFVRSYQNWLGDMHLAMNAAVLVDVWKSTPFMALIILGGLQTIPSELYESARIDGASVVQRFRHITLPMLAPVLLVGMLLRTLDVFRVFDLIYVLTGGGPADSTEVLSTLTYKVLFSATQLGYGSALATAMFLSVLAISAVFLFFLRDKWEVN